MEKPLKSFFSMIKIGCAWNLIQQYIFHSESGHVDIKIEAGPFYPQGKKHLHKPIVKLL